MPVFTVHLINLEGVKETARLDAPNPDALRDAVRKKLPGYQIQKVKLVREADDGR